MWLTSREKVERAAMASSTGMAILAVARLAEPGGGGGGGGELCWAVGSGSEVVVVETEFVRGAREMQTNAATYS